MRCYLHEYKVIECKQQNLLIKSCFFTEARSRNKYKIIFIRRNVRHECAPTRCVLIRAATCETRRRVKRPVSINN